MSAQVRRQSKFLAVFFSCICFNEKRIKKVPKSGTAVQLPQIQGSGHCSQPVVTTKENSTYRKRNLPYSLNPKTETLVQQEARETSSVIYATIGETLATS